jgi:lipoate-protein ligase A
MPKAWRASMRTVRWLDSGLRTGSENLSIDRAWLSLNAQDQRPDLLRFYRSHACASVGCHQAIDRELRINYCAKNNIEMLRRMTGGGALYTDQQQLGFSLILHNATAYEASLEGWLKYACEAIALALNQFGLNTNYKFPNDVEIEGRKIASVFAIFQAGTVLLHGAVLLGVDVKSMLQALRVPTEKISPDGLAAARDRLATVSEYDTTISADAIQTAISTSMAATFGFDLLHSATEDIELLPLPDAEHSNAFQIDWRDASDEFLEVLWKTAGGLLRCHAAFDSHGDRVRRIEFAADMHAAQPHLLHELQQALTDRPVALLAVETKRFFMHCHHAIPGIIGRDFVHLIGLLLDKFSTCHSLGLTTEQANTLMLHSAGKLTTSEILQCASVMLVPYCAKPAWCKWRHQDGCSECGLCEVGDAYRLARERGMRVTTVMRYEHLVETLNEMKTDGVPAYIGMCCSNFYIKRHRAFQEAGMPALLMDISGANCYELQQEDQAYAGTFQALAKLDAALLQRVMQCVPGIHSKENKNEAVRIA